MPPPPDRIPIEWQAFRKQWWSLSRDPFVAKQILGLTRLRGAVV